MRGLLLSLSKLDVNAESFLRIITYFDELVRHRASLDTLVRASAALAECPAGLRDDLTGVILQFEESGGRSAAIGTEASVEESVVIDEQTVGSVWLSRPGERQQFDEMLVERMALAAAALWQHDLGRATVASAEPALLELVISDRAGEMDRFRALRLLGFSESAPIQLLALSVEGPSELRRCVRELSAGIRGSTGYQARGTVIGLKGAVLIQADASRGRIDRHEVESAVRLGASPGTRVGAGSAVEPVDGNFSWCTALTALRFSSRWTRSGCFTSYDQLGAIALLAGLDKEQVSTNGDVRALERLAGSPRGQRDLEALETLLRAGSLRQAALDMHLHHSSVAARLRHVEVALDVSLGDPIGRLRAELALLLWQLQIPAREGQ